MSFSFSGSYNHVTDESVLQTGDSIGEDGDYSLHGYKRVCYIMVNSRLITIYYYYELISAYEYVVSLQGALGEGDLMLICIAPDQEGKFGFNVKVGSSTVLLVLF